jgi:hypothetical protein
VIEKEGWKFARAKAKHLARCEAFRVQGKLPLATDCAAEAKTMARIARARELLAVRIANQCGGKDKTCNGDLTESLPAVLGWGPTCPSFGGGGCDMPIIDCGSIAACLECIHDDGVDDALGIAIGALSLSEPIVNDDRNKCQQKIAKESRKFFDKKSKAIQKCWDKRLKGNHSDTCPNEAALLGSVARKTAEQVAKAESKFVSKVCKRCGGADRWCDDPVAMTNTDVLGGSGGADDLTPGAIGFVASCPDVTIPHGGIACAGAVTTLTEAVECMSCVIEYDVDCMDRAQVPAFETYPPECSP